MPRAGRASPDDLRAALRAHRPGIVSLQFSPSAFRVGRFVHPCLKGICAALKDFEVLLTVHETWTEVGARPSPRGRLVGWVRRREILLAWRHGRFARVFASNPRHLAELARAGVPARRLPIFSNVPAAPRPAGRPGFPEVLAGLDDPPAEPGGLPEHPYVAMLFARIRPEWDPMPALRRLRREAEALNRPLLVVSVGETGYSDRGWRRVVEAAAPDRTLRLGRRSAAEIGRLMHGADCGLSPTPFSFWLKSSACAALVAHGLPLVFSESAVPSETDLPPFFATLGERLIWHRPPPARVARVATPGEIWSAMRAAAPA